MARLSLSKAIQRTSQYATHQTRNKDNWTTEWSFIPSVNWEAEKHRWFSGRMLACHAGGPGSIPGRCNSFFCARFSSFVGLVRQRILKSFDLLIPLPARGANFTRSDRAPIMHEGIISAGATACTEPGRICIVVAEA